jgi:hypothetical protein
MTLELHLQRAVRGFEYRHLLPIDIVGASDASFAPTAFSGLAVDQGADARVGDGLCRHHREPVPGTGEGRHHRQHQNGADAQRDSQGTKIKPAVLEQDILLKWCDQSRRTGGAKTPSFAIMGAFGVEL